MGSSLCTYTQRETDLLSFIKSSFTHKNVSFRLVSFMVINSLKLLLALPRKKDHIHTLIHTLTNTHIQVHTTSHTNTHIHVSEIRSHSVKDTYGDNKSLSAL